MSTNKTNKTFIQDFNEVKEAFEIDDTYDEDYLEVRKYVADLFKSMAASEGEETWGEESFFVKYWAVRLYLLSKDEYDHYELKFDTLVEPYEITIVLHPDYGS